MRLLASAFGTGRRTGLLLHGFAGSRASWDHVAPALENHGRWLAVELPGHGAAPLPAASGTAGFLAFIDALAALLASRGEGPVDVIGYSQGARLALALAVRHPDRVRRLVLESGTAGLRRRRARSARRAEEERWAGAIRSRGLDAFMDWWEARPIFAGLGRLPWNARAALRARRMAHDPEQLAASLGVLGVGVQPSFWSSLWRMRRPTLVVTGAEDARYTELGRRMTTELPLAWRVAVPGCGHSPHLEAASAWAKEVRSFLDAPELDRPLLDAVQPGDEVPTARSLP